MLIIRYSVDLNHIPGNSQCVYPFCPETGYYCNVSVCHYVYEAPQLMKLAMII